MIKIDLKLPIGYTASDITEAITAMLPVDKGEIKDTVILRRALDISDKTKPHYRASVGISLSSEREQGLLKMRKKVSHAQRHMLSISAYKGGESPVVIGAGPCGLFAALLLAESGARPTVLERGLAVEDRKKKVELYFKLGLLDEECNVQYGEGGAGTFSDGKLKAGAVDAYKYKVLSELADAGGDEEILYSVGAHLGTDKLCSIVSNIRKRIERLGGNFIFGARFTDLITDSDGVIAVKYEKEGKEHVISTRDAVLAIGHSAKDTVEHLYMRGVKMQARGFGVGVRIEHPREYINNLVYGENYDSRLGEASYHLVTHLKNGRSVYSFCMCPGGTVVAAASEAGGVVTNGMSEYLRDADNSNAAFLVSLTPSDFGAEHPLAGMELQRVIERAAFRAGGGEYRAPAMRLCDFVEKRCARADFSVIPSYPRGVVASAPEEYLPEYVTDSLRASISDFDAWMPGFYLGDAVMTGAETRSTSPVRIIRDEAFEAPGFSGLYPAGEGAGYSGGIVSSATDGLRCAEAIVQKYAASHFG